METMQIVKNAELDCELQIFKSNNDIWFRGKTVCEILGYKDSKKAIRDHVREKHKKKLSEIGQNESFCLKNVQKKTIDNPG